MILVAIATKFEMKEITLQSSDCLQSFRQTKKKTPEILHFHFSLSCSIASVTFFRKNEAENLQNVDVHFAEIPDFEMEYVENNLAH